MIMRHAMVFAPTGPDIRKSEILTWKYLAPQTDGTGKRYAFVELPVDRMTDGSYRFVFDLFDCAGQLTNLKDVLFQCAAGTITVT